MGIQTLLTRHPRLWRHNRYVYPVLSRRSRGVSLGINLNPDGACNFDCAYCCVRRSDAEAPRTGRTRDVDACVVATELRELIAAVRSGDLYLDAPFDQTPTAYRRLSDIAFSGDGEPTASPRLIEVLEAVVHEMTEAHLQTPPTDSGPGETVKLVLITNATLLTRPDVAMALGILDRHHGEIWAKLDAGTESYYRLINRSSVPLSQVLDNIRRTGRVRPIVIQSLFMTVRGEAPPESELEAYLARLTDLRDGGCHIRSVQVYTIARQTAESWVAPLESRWLDLIADRIHRAGFHAETFPAPIDTPA